MSEIIENFEETLLSVNVEENYVLLEFQGPMGPSF